MYAAPSGAAYGWEEMELSVNTVKEYLKRWSMEGRVLEFDVSSATVELAAEALGCEPCRIAKTALL